MADIHTLISRSAQGQGTASVLTDYIFSFGIFSILVLPSRAKIRYDGREDHFKFHITQFPPEIARRNQRCRSVNSTHPPTSRRHSSASFAQLNVFHSTY